MKLLLDQHPRSPNPVGMRWVSHGVVRLSTFCVSPMVRSLVVRSLVVLLSAPLARGQ